LLYINIATSDIQPVKMANNILNQVFTYSQFSSHRFTKYSFSLPRICFTLSIIIVVNTTMSSRALTIASFNIPVYKTISSRYIYIAVASNTIAVISNHIGLAARNIITVVIAVIQVTIAGSAAHKSHIQVTSPAITQVTIIIFSVSVGFFSIRSDIFSTIGSSCACIPSSIGWNCHHIFAIVSSNSADNIRCWFASQSDVFVKSHCSFDVCSYNNHNLAVVFSCAVISLLDSISQVFKAYAFILASFSDTQNLSSGSASPLSQACIAPIASDTSTLYTEAISAALFVRLIVSFAASDALLPIFCSIAPTGVAS
jgi:hypothetical protein